METGGGNRKETGGKQEGNTAGSSGAKSSGAKRINPAGALTGRYEDFQMKTIRKQSKININVELQKITPASTPYINGGLEADLNYTYMYDRLIQSEHKAG